MEQFTNAILNKEDLPLRLSTAFIWLNIAKVLQESLVRGRKIDWMRMGYGFCIDFTGRLRVFPGTPFFEWICWTESYS